MHILSLGLSHTSSSVHLRERLVFDEEQVRAALARLACGHALTSLTEMVILSTCNRVEIYAVSKALDFNELETVLLEARTVLAHELHPHIYHLQDMEAVHHLFKVSAGLDSLVIGEPQILGQVTTALELARGQNAAGPILNRLFQAAIHAGKRARTETAISRNPASVSSLAASVAEKTVGHIRTASVAILGAGEMAELTVEALRKRGVERIRVITRTLERAHEMAQRWNAEAATFESLQQTLSDVDILVSSTSAPHIIVTYDMVAQAMHARAQRPLVLIDIAVPRDIDPDATKIPHVKLFDMDGLNAQLEDSLTSRLNEVPHVNEILEEEAAEFKQFLNSLEMLPIIADIRQQAEAIRSAEVEKTLRRLPDLTDAERERIEVMTQALVKKLLEAPTYRLRAEASSPEAPQYAAVARTLFNLSTDHTRPTSLAAD